MNKSKLLEKKYFQMNDLKDTVEIKQNILQEQIERLTELEGQIKILRNTSSNRVHAEFHEIKKKLQAVDNEFTQKKKRV